MILHCTLSHTHTRGTTAASTTSCLGRRCATQFAFWRWYKFHR